MHLFRFSRLLYLLIPFYTKNSLQEEKCGDYFRTNDGPREFGNICITTKSIDRTRNSLVLRTLEVNYKEVRT